LQKKNKGRKGKLTVDIVWGLAFTTEQGSSYGEETSQLQKISIMRGKPTKGEILFTIRKNGII